MRGYFIKGNKACETIYHGIWVDTETDQYQIDPYTKGHLLSQGFAAYARRGRDNKWQKPEWIRFTTIDQYWSWVYTKLSARCKLYMFCHNSNFDYPVLNVFNKLPADGWKPDKLVIQAPPTIIQLRRDKTTLMLLDTLNFWPTSLTALGQSIGLPKLPMPPKDAHPLAWDNYNKRDVEIIMKATQDWADWLIDGDYGGFAPTLAGQAYRTYRHKYMVHKILIDDNQKALECSRSAYHGGRTEAFYIGKKSGRFYLYDINSMYAHVMANHNYPTVLRWYSSATNPKDLFAMCRKYKVCARCRITTYLPAIGIRHNGKLIYPIGTFDAAISTPEILWLKKHGKIDKVYDMSMYSYAKIFAKYTEHFYKLRLQYKSQGDNVRQQNAKTMANALYGKFGQNGYTYEEYDDTPDYDPKSWTEIDVDTGEHTLYRQLMGKIYKLGDKPESGISHPAICAHVTAYARMYLFDLMMAAGLENLYYVDTDSLLVNSAGKNRLARFIDPKKLGMLKLEGVFGTIEINGAKDYVFGARKKLKGIKRGAEWYDKNVALQDRWSGLAGMLREGNMHTPTTRKMLKNLKRVYDKARVYPDGCVRPFVFADGSIYPVGSGTLPMII